MKTQKQISSVFFPSKFDDKITWDILFFLVVIKNVFEFSTFIVLRGSEYLLYFPCWGRERDDENLNWFLENFASPHRCKIYFIFYMNIFMTVKCYMSILRYFFLMFCATISIKILNTALISFDVHTHKIYFFLLQANIFELLHLMHVAHEGGICYASALINF